MPRTMAAIYALHLRCGVFAFAFVLPEDQRERPRSRVAHHPVPCLDLDRAFCLRLHPNIVHYIPHIPDMPHITAYRISQPITNGITTRNEAASITCKRALAETSSRNWASSLSCTRCANCRASSTMPNCCVDMELLRDGMTECCDTNTH